MVYYGELAGILILAYVAFWLLYLSLQILRCLTPEALLHRQQQQQKQREESAPSQKAMDRWEEHRKKRPESNLQEQQRRQEIAAEQAAEDDREEKEWVAQFAELKKALEGEEKVWEEEKKTRLKREVGEI
ncbi:hypothetical protein BLS_007189 [Venturia inaequalis]|uniref:Uncharacterized protein n=1 Tax=Venturia inaequalis TaxID=5025 RepID=A0A8H3YMG4_VENIN|nr:hypothetical protein BLS_007189 [Venturia inaequalis]KAE9988318.1 hypothetical protein EG328_011691 [Venturia inaequalis]KAE9994523.1 hypothetical protein EG327_009201 [Venturia inaequalis]